ncbi:hypothetical protein ACTXT7_015008 [Hymenolepis weldensis]
MKGKRDTNPPIVYWIVKATLYLIEHPNCDSPNNSYAATVEPSQLATKTARVLAGLAVHGRRFEPDGPWYEWARADNLLPTEEEELRGGKWNSQEDNDENETASSSSDSEEEIK